MKQIMKTAHKLWATGRYSNWSQCLKMSWRKHFFLKDLRQGNVSFFFNKTNGILRRASGTLRASSFKDHTFMNSPKKSPVSLVKYWDLEKKGFRSFHVDRLV